MENVQSYSEMDSGMMYQNQLRGSGCLKSLRKEEEVVDKMCVKPYMLRASCSGCGKYCARMAGHGLETRPIGIGRTNSLHIEAAVISLALLFEK